jgi:DNA polymerase
VVSDFSAIEARVSAWFAGEEWRLQVFRDGGDIYCASASQMFKVPVVKNGINGELRQKGKVAELALGYGGGVNALKAFGADKMGMSNEEMAQTVDQWRAASPNIVEIWSSLDRAMKRCIVHRATTVDKVAGVRFRWDSGIVWMRLPSGREMAYYHPEYGESRYTPGKMTISYMGVDQKTRKWSRIETWGGRIFENLVQATSRDALRDTMMRLDAAGWDIRGHVHDEVICSEPIGGKTVDEMCAIFAQPLDWAPGLPLTGAGYETPFYMKD